MNQGNERTTSMSKTKGLVTDGNLCSTYCSAGIRPRLSDISHWIYKGDDHPYPGNPWDL